MLVTLYHGMRSLLIRVSVLYLLANDHRGKIIFSNGLTNCCIRNSYVPTGYRYLGWRCDHYFQSRCKCGLVATHALQAIMLALKFGISGERDTNVVLASPCHSTRLAHTSTMRFTSFIFTLVTFALANTAMVTAGVNPNPPPCPQVGKRLQTSSCYDNRGL